MRKPLGTLASLGLGAALWGHWEAGWVPLASSPVRLPGLAPELDGLRIAHLSDFHLGFPFRGEQAVHRAVRWTAARKPDLVAITGDLLSRPGAEPRLRMLLDLLPGSFAVLGNHSFALSRDPFSKASPISDLDSTAVLFDEARTIEFRGSMCKSSEWIRAPIASAPPALPSSPTRMRTSASSSATSRM